MKNLLKNIITILFTIAVITCSLASGVFAAAKQERLEDVKKEFLLADIINDGKIDQGEFDIYHYNLFKQLDSNQDLVIAPEECVSNCFTDKSKVQKMDNVKFEFKNIDIDGSGVIQIYELILHGRMKFKMNDINGDHLIDKDEFCNFYQAGITCSIIMAEEGIKDE